MMMNNGVKRTAILGCTFDDATVGGASYPCALVKGKLFQKGLTRLDQFKSSGLDFFGFLMNLYEARRK